MPVDPRTLTDAQIREEIDKAADAYEVDKVALFRLLTQESRRQGFNSDGSVKINPTSGARGIAQMLPSTAKGLGINPDDPIESIYGAAKLLNQNAQYIRDNFKGSVSEEQAKRLAYVGYSEGFGWIDNLPNANTVEGFRRRTDALKKAAATGDTGSQYRQQSMDTINNVYGEGLKGSISPSEYAAQSKYSSTGTSPTTGTQGRPQPFDPNKFPSITDYTSVDEKGNVYTDSQAYQQAINAYNVYWQSKKNQQEYEFGPFKMMMDEIINDMAQGIASGNLEEKKATGMLTNRLNSYKNVLDAFEGNAFKYGSVPGAQYLSGTEPGSNLSHFGVPPIPVRGGNTVDPLQFAIDQANMANNLYGSIKTPQVTDYTGGMSIPELAQWMQNKSMPPPANLATSAPPIPGTTPSPSLIQQATTGQEQQMAGMGGTPTYPNVNSVQAFIDSLTRR